MDRYKRMIPIVLLFGMVMIGYSVTLAGEKPPFRTLFDNDLTNITTCDSPYSPAGTPLTQKEIYGSVDETADTGIDVHLLQPGTGWVPLWKSKVYPFKENFAWQQERYGVKSPFDDYMLNGGDVVGDFVQRCREKHLSPFISLRMNDHHRVEFTDCSKEEALKAGQPESIYVSRWYYDHPEYRLDQYFPIPARGDDENFAGYRKKYAMQIRVNHLLNWAIEDVRQQKLSLITEICENYDIDGIELDFVRFPFFFYEDTGLEMRKEIMTSFVSQVRAVLNRTVRNGQKRWLSVRIPEWINGVSGLEQCGFDVQRLDKAGVDIFNLACDYVTEQQNDLSKIHALIPDAALYLEISHLVHRYKLPEQKSIYRTATEQQYYTAAHLAYSRGAQGISAFNFVYYRDHNERAPEDVSEPPFYIFKVLRDPFAVAQQPQDYYLSRHDAAGRPVFGQQFGEQNVFPVVWHATPPVTEFDMDMAPPAGGWKQNGRLRIQLDRSWKDALTGRKPSEAMVRFNGHLLQETDDVSEPYPVKYTVGLGKPEELRAWTVPVEYLKDGINKIELIAPRGCDGKILFMDLAVQ